MNKYKAWCLKNKGFVVLLLLLNLFNITDLISTYAAHFSGRGAEQNIIFAPMLDNIWLTGGLKIGVVIIATVFAGWLYMRWEKEGCNLKVPVVLGSSMVLLLLFATINNSYLAWG